MVLIARYHCTNIRHDAHSQAQALYWQTPGTPAPRRLKAVTLSQAGAKHPARLLTPPHSHDLATNHAAVKQSHPACL